MRASETERRERPHVVSLHVSLDQPHCDQRGPERADRRREVADSIARFFALAPQGMHLGLGRKIGAGKPANLATRVPEGYGRLVRPGRLRVRA